MIDFDWFSDHCRCSRGSRVLQHCITCEAGEGEDTRQWKQNVSGMWENNWILCGLVFGAQLRNLSADLLDYWDCSKEVFHCLPSSTLWLKVHQNQRVPHSRTIWKQQTLFESTFKMYSGPTFSVTKHRLLDIIWAFASNKFFSFHACIEQKKIHSVLYLFYIVIKSKKFERRVNICLGGELSH